jgi:uncharacterized protein
MIISNSSPLILLAKIGKLSLLEKIYNKVLIPYEVYREVIIQGKKENYSDAALVEKYVNEFIFVKDLVQEHKKDAEKLKEVIGLGESEAIGLCIQEKSKSLLMDNLEPRKIAKSKGLECISAPGVLLEALKNRIITAEEYESAIKELSKFAWLSGDIVAHFLEIGYKLKERYRK